MRSQLEQIKAGLEYTFMDVLSLRGGYTWPNDERGVNLGIGLQTNISGIRFGFDYAYTYLGTLGNANRLAVQFSL